MEIPDVLVVTKADLGRGRAARAARPPRRAALARRARHAGRRGVRRSPPPQGIDELVAALDAHRARLDLAARRAGGPPRAARWPTSPPSTASAACARSAAGASGAAGAGGPGPGGRRAGAAWRRWRPRRGCGEARAAPDGSGRWRWGRRVAELFGATNLGTALTFGRHGLRRRGHLDRGQAAGVAWARWDSTTATRAAPRRPRPPDRGRARLGHRPLQLPLPVLHAGRGAALAGARRDPALRGDRAPRRAAGLDGRGRRAADRRRAARAPRLAAAGRDARRRRRPATTSRSPRTATCSSATPRRSSHAGVDALQRLGRLAAARPLLRR